MWALIERAYGNYDISFHKTKKDALIFLGCAYTSKRLTAGAYEISTDDSDHIICKADRIGDMGFGDKNR